jgi:hypothetical protein
MPAPLAWRPLRYGLAAVLAVALGIVTYVHLRPGKELNGGPLSMGQYGSGIGRPWM